MQLQPTHLLAALALLSAAAGQLGVPGREIELVSQQCLGCICEASTKCDLSVDCSSGFCGPFLIGRSYFIDSELSAEPAFKNKSFESCAREPHCAAATIRKYMAKHANDCDRDGRVSCIDFATIHKKGPGGCERNAPLPPNNKYWSRLKACLRAYPNA